MVVVELGGGTKTICRLCLPSAPSHSAGHCIAPVAKQPGIPRPRRLQATRPATVINLPPPASPSLPPSSPPPLLPASLLCSSRVSDDFCSLAFSIHLLLVANALIRMGRTCEFTPRRGGKGRRSTGGNWYTQGKKERHEKREINRRR